MCVNEIEQGRKEKMYSVNYITRNCREDRSLSNNYCTCAYMKRCGMRFTCF